MPQDQRNNIIYQWKCKDCSATYIGETKRSLDQRAKEHKAAVRKGNTKTNEIADHCWNHNHTFDWDERTILNYEYNTIKRKMKETIHTMQERSHINNISYRLPEIWHPALHHYHRNHQANRLPSFYVVMT